MIPFVMALSTQLTLGGPVTPGSSDAAALIAKLAKEQEGYFEQPLSRSTRLEAARTNLVEVFEECEKANWDGYGAKPISADTYRMAYRILESLPPHLQVPDWGAEPDGQITMEWHKSPDWTLSVSITDTGELHYSALLGSARAYGTEVFFGDFPVAVADLVTRVTRG